MKTIPKEDKHFKLGHSRNEAFGDSDRGLIYFAKTGCTRVDGNALLSKDNVPVNVHYHEFLKRHGRTPRFVHVSGKPVNTSLPVRHFTATELQQNFWSEGEHYHIRPSIDRIEHAFQLGMDYELEVKEHMPFDVAQELFWAVQELRQWHYRDREVIAKALAQRPGTPVYDLRPYHYAGFPTLITSHRPGFTVHPEAAVWIDRGRGFPVRYR